MNYVWEAAINAHRKEIKQNSLTYCFDDDFSPYIELSFEDINEVGIPLDIFINPYYRYYEVFKTLLCPDMSLDDDEFKKMLFNVDFIRKSLADEVFKRIFFPNLTANEQEFKQLLTNDEFIRNNVINEIEQRLIEAEKHGRKYISDEKLSRVRNRDFKQDNPDIVAIIFDIVVHHLIHVDVHMGMNKQEYHIKFIIDDMYCGYMGSYIQENIDIFTREEQYVIANCILAVYKIGEEIFLLKESVRRIFKGSYIFSNAEERDEVIFYLRTEQTLLKQRKIDFLQYLFLPFKCTCDIYWSKIFGIFGDPKLMVMGEIVMY